MKKIPVLLGVLIIAVAANADMIVPRLSLNFPGTYFPSSYASSGVDTEVSGAAGVEYLHSSSEKLMLGIGAQYIFDTKLKDTPDTVNLLPVYLTAVFIPVKANKGFVPYIKVNAGCNTAFKSSNNDIESNDLETGFYWAAGIGANFLNNICADILYFYNMNLTADKKLSAICLNLGYGFSI
jgi:hypothetical protein